MFKKIKLLLCNKKFLTIRLFFSLEAIAKLLCARKSMVLPPVLRTSWLARAVPMRTCPNGQARRHGKNWHQKGDFMGHMSFVIASLALIGFFFLNLSNLEAIDSDFDGSKPLTINICSNRNGIGLERDMDILTQELTNLGHFVRSDLGLIIANPDNKDNGLIPKVDVNIFIEVISAELFPYAEKNYFIPNPDWCRHSGHIIAQFDRILCKTHETLRIFKNLNSNSVYMGFTSGDRYNPDITKHYRQSLHLAGRSMQKNTGPLAEAWKVNPQFPMMTVISHRAQFPSLPNVIHLYGYLSHEEISLYQNSCGLHICPSGMEGFGHYIVEGLSSFGVVVTLDAPPMNEFVKDPRCLIPYSSYHPHLLANFYEVDPLEIAKVVNNILSLPDEELMEIGKKNREFYLENDRIFKENLAEIFPQYVN